MIKILFYIDTLEAGGAEKVLRTLVNHMDQTKFAITVMTAFQEDASKYLSPGIIYRSLYGCKTKASRWQLRLEAALGLTYRLRIKGDYDIEVAYLECAPTKIIAGSTNKRALKVAWVHCDLEKKTANPVAFVKKTKGWYPKYDKVVLVSENAKDSFVRMYGEGFDALVLHNVNDEDEILTKANAFQPARDGRKILTAVGRLTPQKGFDRLLQAAAMLKQAGAAFLLRIVGEGPQRPELEAMIKDLGLSKDVVLLGYQENPYPYIQASDIIVCSSRYEGLSTVVTEALILGKAVVTTPCTGMDELLGDSEFGLITQDSVQGLCSGIQKLLSQEHTRKHYEKAAKHRAEAFSKTTILEETEEFFRSSLNKKRNK